MDIHIVVSLAEIPNTNLVEVVESQTPGYRVEQARVCYGNGDDLGNVELEEVGVSQDGPIVGITDEGEDEEWYRDEVQQRGDDGGVAAGFGRGHVGLGHSMASNLTPWEQSAGGETTVP